MEGKDDPPELRGITPRAFEQIFYGIEQHPDTQYLIRASFLEIYNEEIHDLLSKNSKNKLDVKENSDQGFYVKDLTTFVVKGITEIKEVQDAGRKNRHVGETQMNRDSSRSHCIFSITIETSATDDKGMVHYKVGKLNLVDLAGSERQSKTGSTGERLKEATNINKSLLTLGNVISSLVDGSSTHIPYRDSKLTKLLQDSLGGNTKTVMCANIGPADWNFDETISTLRYANRAKNIQCKPHINEDPKDAMLRQFQEEIMQLKAQLEMQGGQINADQMSMGGQILQAGEPKVVEKVVPVEDKEKIKEIEEKLAKEKEGILSEVEERKKEIEAQKNLAEDEKRRLIEELQKNVEEQNKAKENQSKLVKKLKAMEEKLVQGSQIMEQAVRQEQELQKAKMELEMRAQQERQLARELEEKEEHNINLEQQFSSQQEEIEDKNKKLKKLFSKYQQAHAEINDLQHEFQLERQDLVDTISVLTQQLKLKNLVLDNFIPQDELMRIENMAQYSEEAEDWLIPRADLAGNNIRGPMAGSVKKKNKKDAEQYDGMVQQRVQNAVANILQEYDTESQAMPVDSHPNVYFVYSENGAVREESDPKAQKQKRLRSAKSAKRPGTASRKRPGSALQKEPKPNAQEQFPKARGLVTSKK
eukprot:CAMPEP_0202432614 /NCGR_PEP_ID=MMETSP1345-20130828/9942_1 /ASSEMBLY_ACC=CAM_ASM_000843 /TAXON_ID=342563 /ORGANISM="Fabrea Fabrea salina" /LENGTH=644 /DNA_ID=CAMNT_0049044703 /DNA_START=293 /DNA_END=2230 /DNA_ORIENTATION=-